jgi:hypothetical protein
MTVVLARSRESADRLKGDSQWVTIGPTAAPLDPRRRRRGTAAALAAAFEEIAPEWLALASRLAGQPNGHLSQTAVCAANVSDFGETMAWARLVAKWGAEPDETLVVCDDPWLFRHLAQIEGARAGRAPRLRTAAARAAARGFAARIFAALRFAVATQWLRHQRRAIAAGRTSLLVYGHPVSRPDGYDAYFGELMKTDRDLVRVLHVDCPLRAAAGLAHAERPSFSLHAFGHPAYALRLPFVRWRVHGRDFAGANSWLIARAVAREGSGAQAAAIAWQIHCQERWLAVASPSRVIWPWEGHAWERALVERCRRSKIPTVGYQHSVVGRQMLNYRSGPDAAGRRAIPDRVLASGAAWRDRLVGMALPAERIAVAGAWRTARSGASPTFDPDAPTFVALPFDAVIAGEMVDACARIGAKGRFRFVVKDHPMSPFDFAEVPGLARTDQVFASAGRCRAVVFAATTVGIEAALAGVPVIRFLCSRRLAMDVTPEGVEFRACDADELERALEFPPQPVKLNNPEIFAPVDAAVWRSALRSGDREKTHEPVQEAIAR